MRHKSIVTEIKWQPDAVSLWSLVDEVVDLAQQVGGRARSERLLGQRELAGFRPGQQGVEFRKYSRTPIRPGQHLANREAVKLLQSLDPQSFEEALQEGRNRQGVEAQTAGGGGDFKGPLRRPPIARRSSPPSELGLGSGVKCPVEHAPEFAKRPRATPTVLLEVRHAPAIQLP